MKQDFRCAVAALLVVAIPGALAAQGAGLAAADAKELASYRLTMETVKKVQAATVSMIEAMTKDPGLQKLRKIESELEALEKKEELSEAEIERETALQTQKEELRASNAFELGAANSLDEMEASVKKAPIVANALEQAGLTPREYGKFLMAMIQASVAAGFKKSGMIKELPKDVNPENVKFVEEHEAELRAMQAEFEKIGKR